MSGVLNNTTTRFGGVKKLERKLSKMDLKALAVWERIKDPDYYGLRPAPTRSWIGVADEDEDAIALNVVTTCLCGRCKARKNRRQMRGWQRRRKERAA